MTLEVTYDSAGTRGGGTGVVTEETGSEVEFDDQGRLVFRAAPSGDMRRIRTTYVIEIAEAGTTGFGMSL